MTSSFVSRLSSFAGGLLAAAASAPACVCAALMVVVVGGAGPAHAASATEGRLAAASQLAQRGEVDAAIDAYEAVLEELQAKGRDSADVRYDLGTLSLERADLGRAVLHLTAATRLDPRDDDAAFNLALALEARTDRLADVGAAGGAWRAVGASLHPTTTRAAFFALSLLVGLLVALSGFLGEGRAKRVVARARDAAIFALLVAGAALAARLSVERETIAVVLVDEIAAKKAPAADAPPAFTAHAGLSGRVVERKDGHARVRLDNGLEAWIEEAALATVP